MPKINQQNIQVFHIPKDNDTNEIISFIEKNYKILQSYLLVLDDLDSTLKECLNKYELDYILPKKMKLGTAHLENIVNVNLAADSTKNSQNILEKNKDSTFDTKIFKDLIRTGADIDEQRDIVVFNRVNSAANIKSSKNICIFGECAGNIKCNGEYMILPKNTKGKILFNGFTIMPNMLKYKLNLILRNGGILEIKDILKI